MNLWHDLEPGPSVPDVLHVIVEIPKGSRNKYEYHKQTGAFKLDRVLYSPVHYPGDYGFIPQTLAEDGDPSDILVMVNEPTFSGCLIEARIVGVFKMRDKGQNDFKLLASEVMRQVFDIHNEFGRFFDELVYKKELADLMHRALVLLREGKPARLVERSHEEEVMFRGLGLLSSKPVLYVCNVEEAAADKGNEFSARVFARAARRMMLRSPAFLLLCQLDTSHYSLARLRNRCRLGRWPTPPPARRGTERR